MAEWEKWGGWGGVLVLLPLWAAKNIETLSLTLTLLICLPMASKRLWIIGCEVSFVQVFHVIEFCIEKYCGWMLEEYWNDPIVHFLTLPPPPSSLWSAQINSHPSVATSRDCRTLTSWLTLQRSHVLNYKTTRVRPFPIKRLVVGAPFVAPFGGDVRPRAHADLLKLTDWIRAAIIPTKTRPLSAILRELCADKRVSVSCCAATGPSAHVEVISSWTRVDRAGWCIWSWLVLGRVGLGCSTLT